MADLNHPGVLLEEYALMHEPDWGALEKEKEEKLKGGDKND